MHWARKKSGCFSNSFNTSEVAFGVSNVLCFFLSHKALLCPPQRLQTTYQWWQRTLRPHSVDTKPRISLSSAPRKEGNRPHRWVVCWSCAMLFVHQGPAFTAHGSLLFTEKLCCMLLRGLFFFWRGWRGLFGVFFLKISAHRRLPVKKERKKRLFKQNFKICMTTAQSLISVHPHRHPALFARKTLVDISSAQPRINTRESVFPVFWKGCHQSRCYIHYRLTCDWLPALILSCNVVINKGRSDF